MVVFFYYIGDIACRFNFELAFELYQKCMTLSLRFDDKIGNWWWKEPTYNKINL